jgi:hypothetical protein
MNGAGLSGTDQQPPRVISPAARISSSVVQLLNSYTVRGPTHVWTSIDGEAEIVLGVRKAYQGTMSRDLIAAVEHHTGRRVIAFLSANHVNPDIAVESFVLESLGERHYITAASEPIT